MKAFRLNQDYQIVCKSESTRYGFRHLATLLWKGTEYETDKACYYNRTWEAWHFQSVVYSLLEKACKNGHITEAQRKRFRKKLEKTRGR